MVVYFALNALDILGELDAVENKEEIIEWVYGNQVLLTDVNGPGCGGFIGGAFTGPMEGTSVTKYHKSHVTMTYCALLILTILEDDFSRVDRRAITNGLRSLQQDDGSFEAVEFGTEKDMRFVFSAVAVSFILQDFSGIDVDKAAEFVIASQSYDGGFGILPHQESHSGAIYTAVAALSLLGRLQDVGDTEALVHFLVSRQVGGFNGRINKDPDTCYTFWVGGSLQALGLEDLINPEETRRFLLSCQSKIGGFSKFPGNIPDVYPDILHSHFSVCGMSLIKEPGFYPIESSLGLTTRAFKKSTFCSDGQIPKTGSGSTYQTRSFEI